MNNIAKKTILLVEDEVFIALDESQTIKQFGYDVIIAHSGEKAVEIVEKNKEINLILMDIDLGKGIDGTESARRILEKNDIPIVFLTSHTEREMVERVRHITRYGYVLKDAGDFVLQSSIEMAFELFDAVNERKKAEDILLHNEALLKHSQRVAKLGHYVFDINSGIWTCSEMLDEIFGISPEYERTVSNWLNIVHPEHFQEMMDYLSNYVIAQKNPFDKEYRIQKVNTGETCWVHGLGNLEFDVDGNPVKMFGVIQDITDKKNSENELIENKESLSTTLQSIGDAVIATDINGIITRMNKVAEQLTGWDFSEAKDKSLSEVFNIVNSETRLKVENPVNNVILSGQIMGLSNHTVLISCEGNEYQISDSAAPIRDNNGNIKGVILVFSDVTEKYNSEERIRESEKLYKMIFNSVPEGIIIYKSSGQCISVNADAARIIGGKTEQLLSQNFREIQSWKQAGLFELAEKALKTGELVSGEYHFTTTFGKEVWGSVKFVKFILHGEEHLILMLQDISERKIAEKMLKQSEEKYRSLVENINIGIFQTTMEGKLIHANSTIAEMAGYGDMNEFMSISVQKLYADKFDRERFISELLKNGYVKNLELESVKKDGTVYWISINSVILKDNEGKSTSILGSIQDITERKHMEQDLQESNARLNATLNALPDLMFEIDSEHHITDYRAPNRSILYAPPELFLGKKLEEILPPDVSQIINEALKDASENGYHFGARYSIQLPEGLMWFEISIASNISPNSNSTHFIFLARDITERKQAEEKVSNLLSEVSKLLKEKELLLKEVHHRIKNNMNSIESLLYLQSSTLKNEEAILALQDARSRVKSMGVLYDRLYRHDNYSETPVREYLSTLVDEIVNIFPNREFVKIKKQIDDFTLSEKILFPLGIIVNEIFTNAMKHAFGGRKDGVIEISAIKNENNIILSIQDNGSGFPVSLSNIETKGFGLMLIKIMIEQIDGNFSIESENGTKCIFEFEVQ